MLCTQNIGVEKGRTPDYMVSISQIVMDVFTLAIKRAYPDLDDIPTLIQKGKFADYQCNSAMSVCQVCASHCVSLLCEMHCLWLQVLFFLIIIPLNGL